MSVFQNKGPTLQIRATYLYSVCNTVFFGAFKACSTTSTFPTEGPIVTLSATLAAYRRLPSLIWESYEAKKERWDADTC